MQRNVVAADIHIVRHTISLYGVRTTAFHVSSVSPGAKPPSALGAWNAIAKTISVGTTKNSSSHMNDGSVVSTSDQFLFPVSFKALGVYHIHAKR